MLTGSGKDEIAGEPRDGYWFARCFVRRLVGRIFLPRVGRGIRPIRAVPRPGLRLEIGNGFRHDVLGRSAIDLEQLARDPACCGRCEE